MNKLMIKILGIVPITFCVMFSNQSKALGVKFHFQEKTIVVKDTTKKKVIKSVKKVNLVHKEENLNMQEALKTPFISIQQLLKGNVAGVRVQENTGEPGALQNILIRGLTSPLFSNVDMLNTQPAIYINGIPLIDDSAFMFSVQGSGVNRLGAGSNILASLDLNSIEKIEVIKDPYELAKLGPNATNGAINITLKGSKNGFREISFNSYLGMAVPEGVSTTNADYERSFRKQFYDKYPGINKLYPNYLTDLSNENYFGASNWADEYYKNGTLSNLNLSIASGSDKASFRFFVGRTSDAGVADKTAYNKSNVGFFLKMAPFSWLNFSTMVTGTRTDRDRNRNLRDRFAETGYLPDLSTPLSPNLNVYKDYLSEFNKSIDDNINNLVRGYIGLDADLNKVKFNTKLAFDYGENIRDVFWPSTIMSSVNYVSNYFGYNQRMVWSNNLEYNFNLNDNSNFELGVFGSVQNDVRRYNYTKAFDGPNDFIKISNSTDFYNYRYADQDKANLISSGGSLVYNYKNLLSSGVLFRYDGSSRVPSDSRWLFSPSIFGEWNFKNYFFRNSKNITDLSARVSWARLGKLINTDLFAVGPQYTVDLGWNSTLIPSYNGYAGLSRPYSTGWIGYNVGWPYSDKYEVEFKGSFFKGKINSSLNFYNSTDKGMMVPVSAPREYGYDKEWKNGMEVNNIGIDFTIAVKIISTPNFSWNTKYNINYNENSLRKLPLGLNELVIGDRKLEVGQPIDRFWVYENKGIYENSTQIPVSATGSKLSYNGIAFQTGDPIWSDVNADFIVDNKDKVLKGNATPNVSGGIYNQFVYKKWDLGFNFVYALGHEAINSRASQKYDFYNLDSANSLESVSEIYFWQTNENEKSYPIYNPASGIHPYQENQDLFLESLSYLKLRTATLGYNYSYKTNKGRAKQMYLYLTGSNLFTLTKFSGSDPELVDFDGYYRGYSLPISRSIILGLKLNL